jgi:hypothetical protein
MKPFRYKIILAVTIVFSLVMRARAAQMPTALIPPPVKLEVKAWNL